MTVADASQDVTDTILEVRGLDASYGPVQILFGLDLEIRRGEIVALLGTNGAGKSTLFKCVTGLLPPTAGSVVFDGTELVGLEPDTVAKRGVVMMPGGKSVFPTLSVRDNLRLASWMQRGDRAAVAAAEDRVLSLFPRLGERIDQMAGNLSGGEQQMLAVSQALIPDPEILLIDELSLGLAPTIVGQLIDVVHQVHEQGLTIVVVEQSINVALELADRAVFMEKGEFRFSGSTAALLDRPDILRSVFIAGADEPAEKADRPSSTPAMPTARRERPDDDAPVILECRGVVKRFGGITAVNQVDLSLREGQILGLIGQNGAGKTTLVNMLIGNLASDTGEVREGANIEMLTIDQRRESLDPGTTLRDALTGGGGDTVIVGGQPRHVVGYMKDFLFAPEQLRTPIERLSGGERGRLMLARALAKPSNLLVLDEPTNDLDLETLDLLQELLADYAGTLLLVSHDRDFLDRVVTSTVAYEGDGRWTEYAGGYSDMLVQRGADLERSDAAPSLSKAVLPEKKPAVSGPKKRLSFNQKRALEILPSRMEDLQSAISNLEATLSDTGLYARDPKKFENATTDLTARQSELDAAEEEWLELEVLREAIEGG